MVYVDHGADISCIPLEDFNQLPGEHRLGIREVDDTFRVKGFAGSERPFGYVDLPTEFGGARVVERWYVTRGLGRHVLGEPAMKALRMTILVEDEAVLVGLTGERVELEREPGLVDVMAIQTASDEKTLEDVKARIAKGTGDLDVADILRIFEEHGGAWKRTRLGCAKVAPYDIELTKPVLIHHKQRRLAPHLVEECRRQVKDLLHAGVITPSTSSHSSSFVFVPKGKGDRICWRMCVDYRLLNAYTVPMNASSLPVIRDALDKIAANGSQFISSLDLKNGYHQCKLTSCASDLSTFSCPLGTYRYRLFPVEWSGAGNLAVGGKRGGEGGEKPVGSLSVLGFTYILRGTSYAINPKTPPEEPL